MLPKHPDVKAPIADNDTWNDCPRCGASWKDEVSTPGLIHRTRLCAPCLMRVGVHGEASSSNS